MKKKIILLCQSESKRFSYFYDCVKNTYEIEILKSLESTLAILDKKQEDYSALIVDNPSCVKGFETLCEFVEHNNNFVVSLPIIILTDSDNKLKDEEYLNDLVLSSIEYGTLEKVVVQRIEKSIAMINSISFADFSKMLKSLPSLIYLKDNKGRYVFCSKYLHHLYSFDDPNWTIRGKTDLEIRKDQENAKAAYETDLNIVKTGEGVSYIIQEHGDDKVEYLQLIKEPVKDKNGKVEGIIAIINNVTEQELLKQELRRKSITDELTGLYNRTYYDEYLQTVNESFYPISVITGDCDGLKIINDIYGHNVGDEYITIASSMFTELLPKSASIFRMGGDEFLAILPKTDEKTAKVLLEKLKAREAQTRIKGQPYSISLGSATVISHYNPITECVNASDLAMYKEKRAKKKRKV